MSFRPMTQSESMVLPPFETLVSRYPGVKAIADECNRIYPDQVNPLQIQSLVKCWRGGPDPLDYISMFDNIGNSALDVPPHWHYVSYGLSDLHCDGRVFSSPVLGTEKSGFGFELTFRLQKQAGEHSPPTWPAHLMQSLARYVFNQGYPLLPGDHMSWHRELNVEDPKSNTMLRQILLMSDPQLQTIVSPVGEVEFVQIVPVITEELIAVQKWNAKGFLELMKQTPQCGGAYLVTDMTRVHTIFYLKPELEDILIDGIARDGSALSGVNAVGLHWTTEAWKYYDDSTVGFLKPEYQQLYYQYYDAQHQRRQADQQEQQRPNVPLPMLSPSSECMDEYRSPLSVESLSSNDSPQESEHQSSDDARSPSPTGDYDGTTDATLAVAMSGLGGNGETERSQHAEHYNSEASHAMMHSLSAEVPSGYSTNVRYFDLIHVTLNLEAGFCFPLALTGRLRHGRHFTFNGIHSNKTVTFVSPQVSGAYVTQAQPFGAFGRWLQVYVCERLMEAMIRDFDNFLGMTNVTYPKTFLWPEWKFGVTLIF